MPSCRRTLSRCFLLLLSLGLLGPSAAHAWLQSAAHDGVAYLLEPARVVPYDLAGGVWLTPIPLPEGLVARAFAVDDHGIVVACATGIIEHSGGAWRDVAALSSATVRAVELTPDLVFAVSGSLLVFDRRAGALLDERPSEGLSSALLVWRDHVLMGGISFLEAIPFTPDGVLGEPARPEYGGGFGTGGPWLLPGDRVLRVDGEIYSLPGLEYAGSLLGKVVAFAHTDTHLLAARYPEVDLFDRDLRLVGSVVRNDYPGALFATGDEFVIFDRLPAGSIVPARISRLSPSDFPPPVPAPPWEPDSPYFGGSGPVAVDPGGVVYLADREHVLRWPVDAPQEAEVVSLTEGLSDLTYDAGGDRLLVLYDSGRIVALPGGRGPEQFFAGQGGACGLAMAGSLLLSCADVPDPSMLLVHDSEGMLLDHAPVAAFFWAGGWDPIRRVLYLLQSSQVQPIPVDPDGVVGTVPEPVRLGRNLSNMAFSPDGSRMVLPSGEVLDAATLEPLVDLGESYRSVAFHGAMPVGLRFVARDDSRNAELVVWTPDGSAPRARAHYRGNPWAVASVGDRIVVATRDSAGAHVRAIEVEDLDGDGVPQDEDAFPDDPSEWSDADGDGVGDNADDFPQDPLEWSDPDGDGVGDNTDAFPDDPTEWSDPDGDGRGDNVDEFPLDPLEWRDIDGDGYGDNGDAFPHDRTEWSDRDGDGVGDHGDVFPDDPLEFVDSDGDGLGDRGDRFPFGDAVLWMPFEGKAKLTLRRLGRLRGPLPSAELVLSDKGIWSICIDGACLGGDWEEVPTRGRSRRFRLGLAPELIAELADDLEEGVESASPYLVEIEMRPETLDFSLAVDPRGRGKLRLEIHHEWRFDFGDKRKRGKYLWKVKRATVGLP